MAAATGAVCLAHLDPAAYPRHGLHAADRHWPETNCYVDLWIELLNSLGFDACAALAFTVGQDFEGDQFTFFKFPPEDLATLFDLAVQELAIYDSVEAHTLEQLRRGRLVLVEVDSYYLPDTRGTSYRQTHGKTTVAINRLDLAGRRLDYFHNAGYYTLEGEDFDGVLRHVPAPRAGEEAMFPYVEFVKRGTATVAADALAAVSRQLLRAHLARRPRQNPIAAFKAAFPAHLDVLAQRPLEFFHLYAFNTLRQLGANFELLGSYLGWLGRHGDKGLDEAAAQCAQIAAGAKTLQFQLARAVARKRFDKLDAPLDGLAQLYDRIFGELTARYGAPPA
jgi:hypothetical protein